MTKENKVSSYNSKIQKLIKDIRAIIAMHISKAEKSDRIMARLRSECIFAKNSYIEKFKDNASFVTIEPYADEVKPELEEGDGEGLGKSRYCRIYANSFGPFNAEKFFNKKKAIIWLLKEPYVKNKELQDLNNGKRQFLGMHGQGQEYYNDGWNVIKQIPKNDGNPTIANVIRISKVILEKQGVPFNGTKEEIMTQVMEHICIIEVNPFPGLALSGTDSDNDLLKDWLNIFRHLIDCFFEFYQCRTIVTNRDVLSLYVNRFDNDYKETKAQDVINFMTSNSYEVMTSQKGYPSALMFEQEIKPFFNELNISVNEERNTKFGPVAVYDTSNRIWTGWYHTSARNEMSKINIQFIGSWISELMNKTGV